MSGENDLHDEPATGGIVPEMQARMAALEAALDEIQGAAFAMSRAANGSVQTMCVPIGAWENAMRLLEPRQ